MTIYKVINGKRYDTRSASLLAEATNGFLSTDFSWKNEELYRKKTGEYFLAAEGGPLTEYGVHIGNSSGFGSRIIPYSEAQARKWVEDHCSGDEYDRIFGTESEEDTARITISLPDSLAKKFGLAAARENLTLSAACRILIQNFINETENNLDTYIESLNEEI